jgi:DNA-binding Xre family transcriptional regulator
MIKLRIQERCRKRKIRNAAKLAELCGFSTSVAYPLFKGTGTRMDFGHMDKLCEVLRCEPGDLFIRVKAEQGSVTATQQKKSPQPKSPVEIFVK